MLGRLGDAVLAGVGVANAVFGLLLALLFGFDTGAQAIIARATGAGRTGRLGEVLTDAVTGSALLGAVLAALLWAFGPPLLALMLPDPRAAAIAGDFARAAAPSLLFLGVTIPINAAWIGSGRPQLAFITTLLLAPFQVGVTLLLIFGAGPIPALGAAGAGAATTLTTLAGIGLQLFLALRLRPIAGFLRVAPSPAGVGAIIAIGWPVSVQQSLVTFGAMLAFVIVARLGVAQAAVINVLSSLTMVPIQCTTGLGVAAATLVGQSLGRGDVAEARAWGWRTAGAGVIFAAPLGMAALLIPHAVLGVFLHDPATIALAVWPLRWLGLGVAFDALGRILGYALRGAGATKFATVVPFASQWLVELPLMWWVGLRLRYGVLGITIVRTALMAAEAAALAWIWRSDSWTGVRIGERPTPPADVSLQGEISRASP